MAAPANGKQRRQAGAAARSKTKGKPGGWGGGRVGKGIGSGIREAGADGDVDCLKSGRKGRESGGRVRGGASDAGAGRGEAVIRVEKIWEECVRVEGGEVGSNLKGGGNCS